MMVDIIRASADHLEEIFELEKSAFSYPWSRADFEYELTCADSVFFAALSGKNTVGFVVVRLEGEEAELYNIAVNDKYRNRGIGRDLLAAALQEAAARGAERVFLEVRASNNAAKALYEKNGFEMIGVRPGYYDCPKEDAVMMARDLKEDKEE